MRLYIPTQVLLLAEKKPAKEFPLDANERHARKARLKELKGQSPKYSAYALLFYTEYVISFHF